MYDLFVLLETFIEGWMSVRLRVGIYLVSPPKGFFTQIGISWGSNVSDQNFLISPLILHDICYLYASGSYVFVSSILYFFTIWCKSMGHTNGRLASSRSHFLRRCNTNCQESRLSEKVHCHSCHSSLYLGRLLRTKIGEITTIHTYTYLPEHYFDQNSE